MSIRGLYAVMSDCAYADRREEFVTWYKEVHFPDLLSVPGFVSARLYESPEGPSPQFMAVYELAADDISEPMAALQKRIPEFIADGRISECLDKKFGRHFILLEEQAAV
jgi:hypothetical protein